ncbi:hypothetical protein GYM24_000002 [Escherichia coli]|nr:hypothetical protein [Escherichia coli]
MFAGKKSAQIREILISESAWEEMTCLFAPSLRESGMSIILHNAPPRWEFVVYLTESDVDSDDLDEIALRRHELIEQGVAERDLPL